MKLTCESVVLHQSVSISEKYIDSEDYIEIIAYPTIEATPIDLGLGSYFFANPSLDLGKNKFPARLLIQVFCSQSKQTRLTSDGFSGIFASLSVDKERFDRLIFCAMNRICLSDLSLTFNQTMLEGIHEHKQVITIDRFEFSIGKEFKYSDLIDKKIMDNFNQAVDKKNRRLELAYHTLVVAALLKVIFFIS